MKLRKIDPQSIKVPEVRVTSQFDPEMLAMFKESTRSQGIIAPILCCEMGEDLVLIDGLHRLTEALENKLPRIDVVIVPGDMTDVLTKNLYLDHMRGKHPIYEMVKVIETLWKEYNLDSEKIAAKTGFSRDYIERLQRISMLEPRCRQALEEGRIGVGEATVLTLLPTPAGQEMALNQQLVWGLSVKDFTTWVKSILDIKSETSTAPRSDTPRAPVKLECAFCHGQFELGQVANPNTCQECSSIMFATMAEAKRQLAAEQPPKTE